MSNLKINDPLKLLSFEMPWRLMGQLTNSNICRTVTEGPFTLQICQRCTFDPKKKNPYWAGTRP